MSTFEWDDELTDLAIKNQTHQSWAVAKPADMLKAIRIISQSAGGYPSTSREELRAAVGTDHFDFLDRLAQFGFVIEQPDSQAQLAYFVSKTPQSPGYHTGEFLVNLARNYGAQSPDALAVIGHNFILGARESLEFCAALQRPGMTRESLEKRFLNHLVFNNKLNSHKCPNLFRFLTQLGVIEEAEGLYRLGHSPAPLTFYCMVERYLLEANYLIETRVNAADQECYLDRLLPGGTNRDMRYEFLGLSKFPFEGWGKYDTWLTGAGFRELLRIGLIHPLSVAKVLTKLSSDPNCETRDGAQRGIEKLREKLVTDTESEPVWEMPLEGLDEWRRTFGVTKSADRRADQASQL